MTLDYFLKHEVDDFDADSSCIYLKLDKDKYDLPPMTLKSELKRWMLLKFLPLCGDGELSDLRVELERNSKELEVYKKALDMACEQLWDDFSDCDNCPARNDIDKCTTNYCGVTSYDLAKYYLQKARDCE